MNKNIYLPGSGKQLELLLQQVDVKGMAVLVMGSACEEIAAAFAKLTGKTVELIVEDLDSMLNANLILEEQDNINVKIMEFDVTDFGNATFDLVYAQASISSFKRNQVVKEIKRLLKDNGTLCVGEVIKLANDVPTFVQNVFDSSDIEPLFEKNLKSYYTQRKYEVINEWDLKNTLEEYFGHNLKKLEQSKTGLSDDEKKYYKKLLNKISHDSNVYIKQGGDKYIGFKVLLLKKGNN